MSQKHSDKPSNGAIGTTPPECKLDVKPTPKTSTPKFYVGDKVLISSDSRIHAPFRGSVAKIVFINGNDSYMVAVGTATYSFHVSHLSPYTEPENKMTIKQTISDEELDKLIFELIRIRDTRRHNERELTDILDKFHGYHIEQ